MDLVLRHASIVDGTGAPAHEGDVVVDGETIAAIESPGAARGVRTIDCKGLVVAPGFFDTHSHSDLRLLVEPDLPMKLRQGVTHEVLGQDGISVAPVRPDDHEEAKRQLAGLLGSPKVDWSWESVGDFIARVRSVRPTATHTVLVPHGTLRRYVMGAEDRSPTNEELARMRRVLGEALEAGAVGMSTGLIYPPCCYARTEELIELCREIARRDRVFVAHMRSESDRIERAVDEMIRIARESGARSHISHFKIAGRSNWDKAEAIVGAIEKARASGLRLTADQYPYAAGSTMLGAILPPWAHAGGVEAVLGRLGDAQERARMEREMLEPAPQDWDNFWGWTGPDGIVVSDIPSGRHPELVGKTVTEIARLRGRGEGPIPAAMNLLLEERMGASMVSHSQSEAVVEAFLRLPWANVCTDGLLGGRPHPRAYGTYPRILGRFVRERRTIGLEEAVRKMTSQAADTFRQPGGRIARGARADLVVFDPETVRDTATFDDPCRFPEGIPYVVVAGRVVVG